MASGRPGIPLVLAAALAVAAPAACGGGGPPADPGGIEDASRGDGPATDAASPDAPTGDPGPGRDPAPADGAADPAPEGAADPGPGTDLPPDRGPDAPVDPGTDPVPDGPPADGADPDGTADADAPVAADVPPDPLTAAWCFRDQLPPSGVPPIDYDAFHPVLGSHCKGTNHQDIRDVERVVFVGDSITTGTPPTIPGDWYRNRLALALVQRFHLAMPNLLWQTVDLFGSGQVYQRESGDFACCAKFGARTDDLTREPHMQMITCNPPEQRQKRTLILSTVGGNDIFAWAQDMVDGVPLTDLWAAAVAAVEDLETSVHWAVDDPATFPNGVYMVLANTFEFSDRDSGRDLADCPGAGIISMNTALIDPGFQELSRYFTSEYMRIVTETGIDMVFFGEWACGHGYMRQDPSGRCYRGEDNALWLDVTCMHPGSAGHAGIADLFLAVIDE